MSLILPSLTLPGMPEARTLVVLNTMLILMLV